MVAVVFEVERRSLKGQKVKQVSSRSAKQKTERKNKGKARFGRPERKEQFGEVRGESFVKKERTGSQVKKGKEGKEGKSGLRKERKERKEREERG